MMAHSAIPSVPRYARALRTAPLSRRSFVDPASAHRVSGLWGDTARQDEPAAKLTPRASALGRMSQKEAAR